MKITLVGHTLEGITMASCLAEIGNNVYLTPIDEYEFDDNLFEHSSMQESGLQSLFKTQIDDKRLKISTEINVEEYSSDLYIVTTIPDGDVTVLSLLDKFSQDKRCKGLIFTCSLPVGEIDKTKNLSHLPIAYIPEYIREGRALEDFRNLNTLTIGCENPELLKLIKELYKPFIQSQTSVQIMTIKEAEFARFAISAMLATRVSFMNDLANISDVLNIDIDAIQRALGSDPRIGDQYLNPGIGFGGRQLANDLLLVSDLENSQPDNIGLLNRVMKVNERQKETLFRKVWRYFQGDIRGKTFAVWGGAFKPNSTKIHNAPILTLIEAFAHQDAILNIYDPGCAEELNDYIEKNNLSSHVGICDGPYSALDGADALLIVTEWREFLMPDFEEIKKRLVNPLIFDGRNIYDPERMKERGYRYFAIGRGERT